MYLAIDQSARYLRSRSHSLALGVFDGVHLGHAQVLKRAAWALTFHPHPREVLKPGSLVTYLTPMAEKKILIPNLMVLKFTKAFADMTPEKFVHDVLVKQLKVKEVYVGYDFCFGKNRSGNIDTLIRLGRQYGFQIDVVPVYKKNGIEVRSSKIRDCLKSGEVSLAGKLLGRPYRVSGTVAKGLGLGRKLGYPTANVQIDPQKCLPAVGIYKAYAWAGGRRYKAAVSIGYRPTLNKQLGLAVEAYLLGRKASLYGQTLHIDFLEYLRPEQKFADLEALKRQIGADVRKAWGRAGKG